MICRNGTNQFTAKVTRQLWSARATTMDRIRGGEFPRVAGGTHAPMLLIVCMFIPGCGNDETHPVMSETKSVSSQKSDDDYVTSTVCRQCHQKQHDSWHASYHRTMTQEATPATIQGSFDGEPLTVNGYPCRPFRHDNRFLHDACASGLGRTGT